MKKREKKLTLSRETLRALTVPDLERVAGGTTELCGTGNIGCEIAKIFKFTSASCE